MATVLDLSIINHFSIVFAWLLVFGVIYGIMETGSVFQNRAVAVLIAAVVSTLMMTFTGTVSFITGIIPWFVVIAIFIVFLLVLSKSLGFQNEEIVSNFGGKSVVMWIFMLLVVAVVISLVAGGQIADESQVQVDEEGNPVDGGPGTSALGIIRDAKVLGVVVVLAISALAVMLMSGVPKPAA